MQTKHFYMNITQSKVDDLNSLLTVTIEKSDYKATIDKQLKDYRKNANVPGFRKGHIPMGLIKKQYEKPLIYEEVNKILQTGINEYISENKINILGNPLPKADENFDWDSDELKFEFELGLAPEFDIELSEITVPYYKIEVAEEEVDKYIDNFRTRYGKMSKGEKVEEGAVLKGVFHELGEDDKIDEAAEHYHSTIYFNDLKAKELFEGKKIEDVVVVNAQDLYEEEQTLKDVLGAELEEGYNKKLSFKINEISKHEKAEIDQELFDKIYGEGTVSTEEEFRAKVKEESEKMYAGEADRVMLSGALMQITESAEFKLPETFLKKWLKFNNQEPKTDEEIDKIYQDAEKGMRYQLVEGKLAEKYNIEVTQEDISNQAKEAIKQQMAMYGVSPDNLKDEMLQSLAMSSLENDEERQKLADQVFSIKILEILKENINLDEKNVSFDDFIEEVKKQNEKAQEK